MTTSQKPDNGRVPDSGHFSSNFLGRNFMLRYTPMHSKERIQNKKLEQRRIERSVLLCLLSQPWVHDWGTIFNGCYLQFLGWVVLRCGSCPVPWTSVANSSRISFFERNIRMFLVYSSFDENNSVSKYLLEGRRSQK